MLGDDDAGLETCDGHVDEMPIISTVVCLSQSLASTCIYRMLEEKPFMLGSRIHVYNLITVRRATVWL